MSAPSPSPRRRPGFILGDLPGAATIVIALALGCRSTGPATPPEATTPAAARRIAEARIAERADDVTYSYGGIHDNGEAYLVHFTIDRPCPSPVVTAPAPAPAPAPAEVSGGAPRTFTAVVDLCPTAQPSGATVEVQKADGRARFLAGE